jgi:hypothetical protein
MAIWLCGYGETYSSRHVRSPPVWPWSSSRAGRPDLCVVTLQRRKGRGWGIGWAFRVVAPAEQVGVVVVAGSGQGVSVMMRS